MTEVEAVEIVLRGVEWTDCSLCEGSGLLPTHDTGTGLVRCYGCSCGKVPDLSTLAACRELDRPPPVYVPPRLSWDFGDIENVPTKPAVMWMSKEDWDDIKSFGKDSDD